MGILRWLRGRKPPATPIADAQDGRGITVRGRIVSEPSAISPMSDESCALFYLEMFEWDNGGTSHLFSTCSDEPFEIEDSDGSRALIHPAEAVATLRDCEVRKGHNLSDWHRYEKVANRYGLRLLGYDGVTISVDWHERLCQPGRIVTVSGTSNLRHSPIGYRESQTSLELRGPMTIAVE